jgi:hypothetical protein
MKEKELEGSGCGLLKYCSGLCLGGLRKPTETSHRIAKWWQQKEFRTLRDERGVIIYTNLF